MWAGATRPGRMHDQTAVKTEGIDNLLHQYPYVKLLGDSGYRGLANDHPDQVIAPPRKPKKDAPPEQVAAYKAARKAQSSQRIPAEHAIALISRAVTGSGSSSRLPTAYCPVGAEPMISFPWCVRMSMRWPRPQCSARSRPRSVTRPERSEQATPSTTSASAKSAGWRGAG